MKPPKNEKHKDYARYAAQCLDLVTVVPDQKSRIILREMAAEWIKLADVVIPQSK